MGRKKTIRERLEPLEAFLERKTQGKTKKAASNEPPEPMQLKKRKKESSSAQCKSNTKREIPLVNLSDESSEEEDERKYPPILFDILEHYDFATGEEALDFPFKDVTTISIRKARELRKKNPKLQGENNVLDSIIDPRADVSSLSSHSAAARRLMRSMPNIDDKILQKLVGRASDAHLGIVKHLSERNSQDNNVEMVTPPGSPKPPASRRECQAKERRPVRNTGGAANNRRITLAPPSKAREVVIVTSEDEQYESSEEYSYTDTEENEDLDRIARCQPSVEEIDKNEADELDRVSDDGDETTLDISSPSTTVFDDEFTEDE